MQETDSLNEMYTRYTDGRIDRKEFEGGIFKHMLQNFCRRFLGHWRSEDSADFLSWVYPKIHSAIDSYTDTGSSFEAYLGAITQWAAREYRARTVESRNAEYAAWSVCASDFFVHEIDYEYLADNESTETATDDTSDGTSDAYTEPEALKSPRQVLFLILKCYCYVSDDFLNRIAPRLGLSPAKLRSLVDGVRQLRLKYDDNARSMRERMHCQYYRCVMYEKRLADMSENSHVAIRMRIRLEKARKRLVNMRRRVEKLRSDASNRQIADILGLSKGTVDSALHNLKSRWNNNSKGVILN